jgi:hypothetical protein
MRRCCWPDSVFRTTRYPDHPQSFQPPSPTSLVVQQGLSMTMTEDLIPGITWIQLKTILENMADTPAKKTMVKHLVEATRKQAPFLPAEGSFKEILFIGAALLDVRFQPSALDLNTSGASSPSSPSRPLSHW